LIDQLEIDQVIVYGISAGGLTAIALAATHPDKVSKLVLASAVSKKWLDKQDDIYKTAQKLFHPKVERFIWGMIRMVTYIFPGMIAQSFYPQFSTQPMGKLSRQSIHELIDALRKYRSKEGFLNDIDQQLDDDLITKIKSPTLIIHSTYDNSVALEHAEYAHHMILHSSLEVLQNEWGHLFWIGSDSPQSINKTIHFLEDNQV
jgi:pimeloyl-ACP methyl ester carboxylesterase